LSDKTVDHHFSSWVLGSSGQWFSLLGFLGLIIQELVMVLLWWSMYIKC